MALFNLVFVIGDLYCCHCFLITFALIFILSLWIFKYDIPWYARWNWIPSCLLNSIGVLLLLYHYVLYHCLYYIITCIISFGDICVFSVIFVCSRKIFQFVLFVMLCYGQVWPMAEATREVALLIWEYIFIYVQLYIYIYEYI